MGKNFIHRLLVIVIAVLCIDKNIFAYDLNVTILVNSGGFAGWIGDIHHPQWFKVFWGDPSDSVVWGENRDDIICIGIIRVGNPIWFFKVVGYDNNPGNINFWGTVGDVNYSASPGLLYIGYRNSDTGGSCLEVYKKHFGL